MAFTLNTVDLTTYGFMAGHAPGSNIALQGCFDMPERTGKTYHSWGDEHGIEAYTAAGDITFAGRDLTLYGTIIGTSSGINTYVNALKDAIKAFTDLVTLSTPYGDFSVYVKDVKVNKMNGAAEVVMSFREPVVTLTGGSLPATGSNANTLDDIPLSSFGLYLASSKELHDLPEVKEQFFTKYGAEGYQITKRKAETLSLTGVIIASSLADFQSKIKALYLAFKTAGTRDIVLNDELKVTCFAAEGFKVSNVILHNGGMVGKFDMSLIITDTKDVVRDIDGNTYSYVTVGSLEWMTENLKTTKYADGTAIPKIEASITDNNWRLPSRDELALMYSVLHASGKGNFVSDATGYWTSSEYGATPETHAYYIPFNTGVASNATKGSIKRTRGQIYTQTTNVYSLGDRGEVGWVFKIDNLGGGLYGYYEASPIDTDLSAWSNITNVRVGTNTDIEEGAANTSAIRSQTGHTNSAAKVCWDLIVPGWTDDTTGAYCWYDNDVANKDVYGALYNTYAVKNAKGLAPAGWRIATAADYEALLLSVDPAYSGSYSATAGDKLRETGTDHWDSPNAATDDISFSLTGNGYRHSAGLFSFLKVNGCLWTSTAFNASNYDYLLIQNFSAEAQILLAELKYGMGVRCVRDK